MHAVRLQRPTSSSRRSSVRCTAFVKGQGRVGQLSFRSRKESYSGTHGEQYRLSCNVYCEILSMTSQFIESTWVQPSNCNMVTVSSCLHIHATLLQQYRRACSTAQKSCYPMAFVYHSDHSGTELTLEHAPDVHRKQHCNQEGFQSDVGTLSAGLPCIPRPQKYWNAIELALLGDTIWEYYVRRHAMFPPAGIRRYRERLESLSAAESQVSQPFMSHLQLLCLKPEKCVVL